MGQMRLQRVTISLKDTSFWHECSPSWVYWHGLAGKTLCLDRCSVMEYVSPMGDMFCGWQGCSATSCPSSRAAPSAPNMAMSTPTSSCL